MRTFVRALRAGLVSVKTQPVAQEAAGVESAASAPESVGGARQWPTVEEEKKVALRSAERRGVRPPTRASAGSAPWNVTSNARALAAARARVVL